MPTNDRSAGDFGNQTLQDEAAQLPAAADASGGSGSAAIPPDLVAVVGQLAVQSGETAAIDGAVKTFQMVRASTIDVSDPVPMLPCSEWHKRELAVQSDGAAAIDGAMDTCQPVQPPYTIGKVDSVHVLA